MQQYFDYNSRMAVPDRLFTPLHGVELTGGLFRQVFDNNVQFTLKQLDTDRMRYWFDVKRGLTPKAERYSGHFEDALKGQTASQFLMAAGNSLRWREIPELRRRMDEILDFLQDTAEPDGFLMPIDKSQFAIREYPHYVRIWLTYGLIAAARGGSKRAFPMLRLWQDWFNRCPDLPVIRYLELAYQGIVASTSVFATEIGCKEDMEICRKYYEETWRLAQFIAREKDAVHIRRQSGHEPHPHGSELESFEGYLDLYRHFGAPYLLNAVLGAWELYSQDWQHPGGGIVMCENTPDRYPGCNFIYPAHYYNELCCSSFWMHLNQRLHRLFPDEEKYVSEMEKSLYNVAIANQSGDVTIRYFANLHDRKSTSYAMPNHCCSGTGTRIFASLPEYLYTLNQDTLSCDIYADSRLEWQTPWQVITVTQQAGFPYDGKVRLQFEMAQGQDFTLRLRFPQYMATEKTPVLLNGAECAHGQRGAYLEIHRHWQSGDSISFEIPFGFQSHLYHGIDEVAGHTRCAYTYGPLLLAAVAPFNHENGLLLSGMPQELTARLQRNASRPLAFDVQGEPNVILKPYFEVQDEQFTCFPLFVTP